MVYKACLATGTPSNTVYIQHAVCEALARDLDIPLQRLLDALPSPRSRANNLFDANRRVVGPASLHEDVKPRPK
jgi:hypothetical protein